MAVPKSNYVGDLQEKCQLANTSLPIYEDVSTEGIFKYTCKLKDWVCCGTGSTKKFAKQNSAKEMLVKIENGKLLSEDLADKLNTNQQKSSVSKLLEYCQKENKGKPLFSELPNEEDLFCCRCTLNDFSADGKGSTKKEAKEKAAFEVAEHFDVHKYFDNLIKSKVRKQMNISPMQELSIFCQKRRLSAPVYEELEVKQDNVMKFKATCSVGELRVESGLAHSKKAAKCEVAVLLLQSLKNNTPQASPHKEHVDDCGVSNVEQKLEPVLKRKMSSDSEEPFMEPLKKNFACTPNV